MSGARRMQPLPGLHSRKVRSQETRGVERRRDAPWSVTFGPGRDLANESEFGIDTRASLRRCVAHVSEVQGGACWTFFPRRGNKNKRLFAGNRPPAACRLPPAARRAGVRLGS